MELTILRSHSPSAHSPSPSPSKPTLQLPDFAFPAPLPEALLRTPTESNIVLRNSTTTLGLVWENLVRGKDGIPKWVWLAISGIVAVLLLVVVISSISGNGGNDSSTAGSDDFQEELKLPSGKELIKILRLPDSVTALIQRRDKNKDGQLTIDEFAYAPTKELLKRLRKYFPLIDLDDDGLLSPTELNRAYFSKG